MKTALPKNIELSDTPTAPPVTEARNETATEFDLTQPEMLGFQCQVQWPTASGKPTTREPGIMGAGVVSTASGVLVTIQTIHADGDNLTAVLDEAELHGWIEILIEVAKHAAQARKSA